MSRAALEESSEDEEGSQEDSEEDESGSEEFADPETADLDADDGEDHEIESDDALCDSDEEHLKDFTFRGSSKPKVNGQKNKRPVAADFLSGSEDDDATSNGGADVGSDDEGEDDSDDLEGLDDDDEDSGSDEDGASLSGEDDEEESDEDGESGSEDDEDEEKSHQDKLSKTVNDMKQGQKSILANISQAAKAEAEKGLAVRQQRRSFDALLNLRIRLQKALVAVNTLSAVDEDAESSKKPYEAAEEAAIKLWNTIDSFRDSLLPASAASAGQKRKREIDADTATQSIWEMMDVTESQALAHRNKVLDKWAAKVRRTPATAARKLIATPNQSLISELQDQMLNSDRLVKRTKIPRSCAPAQAAKKVAEDAQIYDDADFYQLLLKELVDQRSSDTTAPGSAVPTVRWAALKEARTRKQVDRKASKGRKLRFNVHEKLQNFMAPDDRRSWEQDAIDRFFGTLFGQKMELKEDDESDDEMDGVNVEEEGLKLFRS